MFEKGLLDRFPSLFAINDDWAERGVTEHYPIACGDGWFSLIERACLTLTELERRYQDFGCVEPWLPQAAVYTDDSTGHEGLLRFDLRDLPVREGTPLTMAARRFMLAEGMTWMASEISRDVCEVCGNPGRYERERVRCVSHLHVSTRDASADAARKVADLVARAVSPGGARGFIIKVPTKKRPPRG
ncbi:hypothetical protein [Trinickia sp. EG282A]|uniref:hypothetical protein n=1 Tax=Trinickia sp. EG282A TaxID=3237013 RepID=UPI0034D21A64